MEYMKNIIFFVYSNIPLKLKVEYSRTLSLKSKTMMMAVAEASENEP
jgi:hypothetical protein